MMPSRVNAPMHSAASDLCIHVAVPPSSHIPCQARTTDHNATCHLSLVQSDARDGAYDKAYLGDDELVETTAVGLSPPILTALAHVAAANYVSFVVSMHPTVLRVYVHMDVYAKCKQAAMRQHMRRFMAWLLLASRDEWSYPYLSELETMTALVATPLVHPSQLLEHVAPCPFSAAGDAYVPSPHLLPTLRRYQRAAVAWMLEREAGVDPKGTLATLQTTHATHLGTSIAYDPFAAAFVPPRTAPTAIVRGGVLADEMGLGKTLQVLACILSHPCSMPLTVSAAPPPRAWIRNDVSCVCNSTATHSAGVVRCTMCGILQHRICTGADADATFHCEACLRVAHPLWLAKTTLIVSPQSIHKQWEAEVLRHTTPGAVTIYCYIGIKAMRARLRGPSSEWQYSRAPVLATFDIVLTTYEALRDDVHYIQNADVRTLRQAKHYRIAASPLTHLFFWRVCLDEAQLVESQQTQAAVMASHLSMQHRWWVTGTPFGKSLADVHATLAFLRATPLDAKALWRQLTPHDRLVDALQGLVWRNRKCNVDDQIILPPQTTQFHWLELSSIEAHFYDTQHAACTQSYAAGDVVTPAMLQSLLRLRQACCHPQLGAHGIRVLDTTGRVLTMDEILDEMLLHARRTCEDAQRLWIAATNGLAGIDAIEHDAGAAIARYCDAMALVQHHWKDFRADVLPRLHMAVNLQRQLANLVPATSGTADASMPPFLNAKDEHGLPSLASLQACMRQELDGGMLARLVANPSVVSATATALAASARQLEQYYLSTATAQHDAAWHKYTVAHDSVSSRRISAAPLAAISDAQLDRLRASWLGRSDGYQRFARKFTSTAGLIFLASSALEDFATRRIEIHDALVHLSDGMPSARDVALSGNCQRCRQDRYGPVCDHCKLQPSLDTLRATLVDDGDLAVLLQVLGEVHGEYNDVLSAVRKEVACAAKLWQAQHARLGGLDELAMAKTTMTLSTKVDNETVSASFTANTQHQHVALQAIYELHAYELPAKRMALDGERADAHATLSTALNQLRYLQNLRHHRVTSSSRRDDCVVCHEELPIERAVWPCAHVLCRSCTQAMVKSARRALCPTCRRPSTASSIQMVRDEPLRIGPECGTKVDSIVRCILGLGDVRVLLFSQWPDMLRILATALHQGLQAFKAATTSACVLALPFRQGANGLNLVEASHVVLVEPLLNASVERQAINRVHRLGQEKPTTVHRFIVQHSIEEGVLALQARDTHPPLHVTEVVSATDWRLLLQQDHAAMNDGFWSAPMRGPSRRQVKDRLERARSFELRAADARLVDEPTLVVCGVSLSVHVAAQLLRDCIAVDDNDAALLAVLRQRLRVKLHTLGLLAPDGA
ncbi:hypothetical protein SPRG_14478 [Saprolegnia parasitica CBS 223.65]|uniref:Helicase ATP-binding domain-containing protein n=1 Tax=Saprolegnia parasitica (strain CBS 223.65) TaxID=695850 RepID=A0A067C0B0_SAPPC|nr:hypothetical protein SPRG_14478 [Saprolegnia parasitica CBS 223.65]KDO20232.1 hypothetical protein SPRG_14478 [Saprolegnia parasitica CBS 223.65]|eukprot:XP_012209045.1 hypothetical protein SPRG_14478 [Saprolegnia parasitica CBS 223.65]